MSFQAISNRLLKAFDNRSTIALAVRGHLGDELIRIGQQTQKRLKPVTQC